jgi:hypothetical protein
MATFNDLGNSLAERVGQTIITLATGSIVFSVSLLPDGATHSKHPWLLASWAFHLFTVLIGLAFLVSMVWFYYRPKAKIFGKSGLAKLPLCLFVIETVVFLLGLFCLAYFAVSFSDICNSIT